MIEVNEREIQGHDGHEVGVHVSKTTGVEHIVCHTCKKSLVKLQPCEVYSRVVGYLRPTEQWNDGKKAEFKMRKTYNESILLDQ